MDDDAGAPAYTRPLPDPSPATQPFWDGLKEGRLTIQRSTKTGTYVYYPRASSPFGADDTLEWVDVSGRGIVYSYTVARRATAPQWEGATPYVIAIVELEEGPHVMTNIVDCLADDVRIGLPVEAAYTPATPEVTLLHFRPRVARPQSPPTEPVPATATGPAAASD